MQKSLLEFSNSNWQSKIKVSSQYEKEVLSKKVIEKKRLQRRQVHIGETDKNVFTVGYQIGGYSAIGLENNELEL